MDDAEFDKTLKAALDNAEEGLKEGKYKQSLKGLLALSMINIKELVPNASFSDYSKLISVVELASAKNIAETALVNNIKIHGAKVVSIARMVPSLASIL